VICCGGRGYPVGEGRQTSIGVLCLLGLCGLLLSVSPLPGHTQAERWTPASALTPYAYVPYVAAELPDTPEPPPAGWLVVVNSYRTMAGLPSVAEQADWSHGDWLHARYMVKNDVIQHTEDPNNPWYTLEGLAAAQASNLMVSSSVTASDEHAIDGWMQAPFHAVGVIDPALHRVGFGSYREADGGWQMGAGLDVLRGLGSLPPTVQFPVKWPADGTTVGLTSHWGESPSPLTSCPGYSAPSGLPLLLQIGPGDRVPQVTAHSFRQGGTPLDHCVFDETSYSHPDGAQQSLGRAILDGRDAVVLIPRQPLTPGATYAVSITANGQTHTWSFAVSAAAGQGRLAASGMIRPPAPAGAVRGER
jgi:hypothetical protein